MPNYPFAPRSLAQSILPWFQGATFGLFNVIIGNTPRPAVEEAVLEEVGSYGRQLGRIGDALEVVVRRLDALEAQKPLVLTEDDRDALDALRLQLKAIEKIKHR